MFSNRFSSRAAWRSALVCSIAATLVLGGASCGGAGDGPDGGGEVPDASVPDSGLIEPDGGSAQPDGGTPDSGAPDSGTDAGTGFAWSNACSSCHVGEAGAQTAANPKVSGLLGIFHQTNTSFTSTFGTSGGQLCEPCHAPAEATLITLHVSPTGTLPTKLVKTDVTEATCLGCHGSYEALIAKTASSTVLTDNGQGVNETEPKVINPHAAPGLTEGHATAKMTCRSCHGSHKTLSARDYCVTCHHAGVWECQTCHK